MTKIELYCASSKPHVVRFVEANMHDACDELIASFDEDEADVFVADGVGEVTYEVIHHYGKGGRCIALELRTVLAGNLCRHVFTEAN